MWQLATRRSGASLQQYSYHHWCYSRWYCHGSRCWFDEHVRPSWIRCTTLQKQWPNSCWKGFHWPEVGHTMTCLVYMSWRKEVWNHFTHSPQVKWPVRKKTIFMIVGSSLPITLLYQFWWICQSALHPAPHKFQHHSCVNLRSSLLCVNLSIVGADCWTPLK